MNSGFSWALTVNTELPHWSHENWLVWKQTLDQCVLFGPDCVCRPGWVCLSCGDGRGSWWCHPAHLTVTCCWSCVITLFCLVVQMMEILNEMIHNIVWFFIYWYICFVLSFFLNQHLNNFSFFVSHFSLSPISLSVCPHPQIINTSLLPPAG